MSGIRFHVIWRRDSGENLGKVTAKFRVITGDLVLPDTYEELDAATLRVGRLANSSHPR